MTASQRQSHLFAEMYGELTIAFLDDPENAYLLACRAFHHAAVSLKEQR